LNIEDFETFIEVANAGGLSLLRSACASPNPSSAAGFCG
jgi:hypothetical protein